MVDPLPAALLVGDDVVRAHEFDLVFELRRDLLDFELLKVLQRLLRHRLDVFLHINRIAVDGRVAGLRMLRADGHDVRQKRLRLAAGRLVARDKNHRHAEIRGFIRVDADFADLLAVDPHVADVVAVIAMVHVAVGNAFHRMETDFNRRIKTRIRINAWSKIAADGPQLRRILQLRDIHGVAAAMAIPDDDFVRAALQQAAHAGVHFVHQHLAGDRRVDGLVADSVRTTVDSRRAFQIRHDHDLHNFLLLLISKILVF